MWRETELCSSTGHAAMRAHRSVHSTLSSHRQLSYRTLTVNFMDGCSRLLELVFSYFNFCHQKSCHVDDEFLIWELHFVCEIIVNGSPPPLPLFVHEHYFELYFVSSIHEAQRKLSRMIVTRRGTLLIQPDVFPRDLSILHCGQTLRSPSGPDDHWHSSEYRRNDWC